MGGSGRQNNDPQISPHPNFQTCEPYMAQKTLEIWLRLREKVLRKTGYPGLI
jgi:hypothetical protein